MMSRSLYVLLSFTVAGLTSGFAPKSIFVNQQPSTTHLNVVDPTLVDPQAIIDSAQTFLSDAFPSSTNVPIEEIKTARSAFYVCLFGAAGTATLGREVIPRTWRQYTETQALIGSGLGSGGEEIGVFGYPEPIYKNDVVQVLNNNMTAVDIEAAYPGDFPGYLQFDSLVKANANVSPVAVRAVFDSLSVGINKNQIPAIKADRVFDLYRNDSEQMKKNLQLGKVVGVSAFFILMSLIGAADYFALYHLLVGWFPNWEGFSELPASLFDARGISNLGNCWMPDIPSY